MSMSKRKTKHLTIGTSGARLPVIPFKRIFKDASKYDRKEKRKQDWSE